MHRLITSYSATASSLSDLDECTEYRDELCSPQRSDSLVTYKDGQEFTMNRDVVWEHGHCMWRINLDSD